MAGLRQLQLLLPEQTACGVPKTNCTMTQYSDTCVCKQAHQRCGLAPIHAMHNAQCTADKQGSRTTIVFSTS